MTCLKIDSLAAAINTCSGSLSNDIIKLKISIIYYRCNCECYSFIVLLLILQINFIISKKCAKPAIECTVHLVQQILTLYEL